MPDQVTIPTPPPVFAEAPHRRYWGDRKPPKNRADMFSTSTRPAAAADSSAATTDAPTSSTGAVATMRLYGPIDSWGGFWGISAGDVSTALDSLGADVTEIRLRINSPGGEVWEGLTILNMLRAHPARVVAVVDGLAASAASFIAAGCDETVMSPGTQMMIHDASSFAFGPASEMRKAAEFLDSCSNSCAALYAETAGGTDAEWRARMVEETWYTASEAASAGLADRVGVVADAGTATTAGEPEGPALPNTVEDHFDLSIFNYAGRAHAPAPQPPAASADGSITTTEGRPAVAFTTEQLTDMRRELGIAEDADETTIMAALTEALTERAETPAATTAPQGSVLVDEGTLASLRADAAAGREARNEQQAAARRAAVEAAITDGRIPVARRDHWEAQLAADPGAQAVLDSLAAGTIPVAELGHTSEPDTKDELPGVTDAALASFAGQFGLSKEDLRG